MFEQARLVGPTGRSIVVQTREGTDLTNVIDPAPTLQQQRQYRALFKKYGGRWVERKGPTGGYNCAGHIWASRRTSLRHADEWRLILKEDGYRLLEPTEEPSSGDLVVYVSQPDGEIIHVARIMAMRAGLTPGSPKLPWVLSKWGAVGGETMHFSGDVLPLRDLRYDFRLEYWTDR